MTQKLCKSRDYILLDTFWAEKSMIDYISFQKGTDRVSVAATLLHVLMLDVDLDEKFLEEDPTMK